MAIDHADGEQSPHERMLVHLLVYAGQALWRRHRPLDQEIRRHQRTSCLEQAKLLDQAFTMVRRGIDLLERGQTERGCFTSVLTSLRELCDGMMERVDGEIRRADPRSEWIDAGKRIIEEGLARIRELQGEIGGTGRGYRDDREEGR